MKRHLIPTLAAAALLLTACDSPPQQAGSLPPEAAAELKELTELIERVESDTMGAWAFLRHVGLGNERSRLLEEYADTLKPASVRGKLGLTPLHIALMYRREALVRAMLEQGADPNATISLPDAVERREGVDREMDAPLVWTVMYSDGLDMAQVKDTAQTLRLIDLLAEHGADIKGKAGGHTLALCSGYSWVEEEVFLHLLELGADSRQGYLASLVGHSNHGRVLSKPWLRAAAVLVDKGMMEVDEVDEEGETHLYEQLQLLLFDTDCLMGADEEAWHQKLAPVTFLLERGADVNKPQGKRQLFTPLSYAVFMAGKAGKHPTATRRYGELLLALLEHGADLSSRALSVPNEPAGTLADALRRNPSLVDWLAEHGVTLPPATPAETPSNETPSS